MLVQQIDGVIRVTHEGRGTGADAESACAQIRLFILKSATPPYIVHDAQRLGGVDDEYVKCFMKLEAQISGRYAAAYCVIPNLWFRTLAKAVGALSPGQWHFFSTVEEVDQRLAEDRARILGAKT